MATGGRNALPSPRQPVHRMTHGDGKQSCQVDTKTNNSYRMASLGRSASITATVRSNSQAGSGAELEASKRESSWETREKESKQLLKSQQSKTIRNSERLFLVENTGENRTMRFL